MTSSQRLAEQYKGVAFVAARPYLKSIRDPWLREDVEGAAYLGLCQAVANRDSKKGPGFTRYVYLKALSSVRDELRRQGRQGRRIRYTCKLLEVPAPDDPAPVEVQDDLAARRLKLARLAVIFDRESAESRRIRYFFRTQLGVSV